MSVLSAALSKQITRLKGTEAEGEHPDVTVRTAVGPRVLPPAIAAFARVTWAKNRTWLLGDDEREIRFGGSPIEEHLAAKHTGPLYALAYDESQFYEVVRLDDASDDPVVYRIDHDGSSELAYGQPLSRFLVQVKSISTAKPTKLGPQLTAALAGVDGDAALALIASDPKGALAELDKSGFTALHFAAMAGLTPVVTALLAAGADANASLRGDMTFGKKFRGTTWGASRELVTGERPLHSALFEDPRPSGKPRDVQGVVKALLAAGADASALDRYQRAPLQIACKLRPSEDAVVAMLLDGGADPNSDNAYIQGPMANTLTSFSLERLKLLLARGADPNRVTGGSVWHVKGPTPVHMAAIWNLPEALTLILDAGGDPNVAAADGSRPLACAKSKTTEILVARGATSA